MNSGELSVVTCSTDPSSATRGFYLLFSIWHIGPYVFLLKVGGGVAMGRLLATRTKLSLCYLLIRSCDDSFQVMLAGLPFELCCIAR